MVLNMPRLIHLNGPSRVGKSTLARRYGDEHPGTLVLDIDVVAGLIGGWRQDFFSVLRIARGHGRTLAVRHLSEGRDVILPQLVTTHDRDLGFDEVAAQAGAEYIEVVLMADEATHQQRLREKQPTNEVESAIQALLTDPESDLMERAGRHLDEYLLDRPHAVRLDTSGLSAHDTYTQLTNVLGTAQPLGR
jgi:predicted kinase